MAKLTHDTFGFSLHHVRLDNTSYISVEDGDEVIATVRPISELDGSSQLFEEFFRGEMT
jgi:hypothetical protein